MWPGSLQECIIKFNNRRRRGRCAVCFRRIGRRVRSIPKHVEGTIERRAAARRAGQRSQLGHVGRVKGFRRKPVDRAATPFGRVRCAIYLAVHLHAPAVSERLTRVCPFFFARAQQSDRRSTIVGGSAGALLPAAFARSDAHAPAEYAPLPAAFGGAHNLVMPSYLAHRSSGVTLPSRLSSLGSTEFVSIAAMSALDVGNSVVVCPRISRLSRCTGQINHHHHHYPPPRFFSKSLPGLYHFCLSRNIRSRRIVLFLLHVWQALVKFVQEVGVAALYLQQVDGAECVP